MESNTYIPTKKVKQKMTASMIYLCISILGMFVSYTLLLRATTLGALFFLVIIAGYGYLSLKSTDHYLKYKRELKKRGEL